jgi:hypothetical protein
MNVGATRGAKAQVLKRKHLECFNLCLASIATRQKVVTCLIHSGVSRDILNQFGRLCTDYPRVTFFGILGRFPCSIGLRERREGAERKSALRQYGNRPLRVLSARKSKLDPIKVLRVTWEGKEKENQCGPAFRCATKPAKRRLRMNSTDFPTFFNVTIKSS